MAQEREDDLGQKYEAVIYCASKKLKGAELHYSATEGECQAVLWAVKLFRPYICGSIFQLQTDHFALKWLMTCRDLEGKLARWSLKLQMYNMIIVHKKGKLNRNVDALSRAEVLPVQQLVAMAEQTFDEEDLEADFESDGSSYDDLTEEERQTFLQERDRFVNAELARFAALAPMESDNQIDQTCIRFARGFSRTEGWGDPDPFGENEISDEEPDWGPMDDLPMLDLVDEDLMDLADDAGSPPER